MANEVVDGVPEAWFPPDQGLISWAYEPTAAAGTYTLATAGTLYVAALKVTGSSTVSNIVYQVTTAGGTLTSGQCFVGLYQGGALIGTSADQATAWASTGVKTTALATPVKPLPGLVYVAFSFNGTTGPTLAAGSVRANVGLAAAVSRFGTANTGATTALPGTLGTVAALGQSPWAGLS